MASYPRSLRLRPSPSPIADFLPRWPVVTGRRVRPAPRPGARKAPLIAIGALALATAVALMGAADALRAPAAVAGSGTEGAARRFYEAATAVVATGDLSHLDGVVDPNLLARSDPAGLVARLLALHDRAPGIELVPEETMVDGDRVIVRVRAVDARPTAATGPVLLRPVPWAAVDALRFSGDRVVEHRPLGDVPPVVSPLIPPALTATTDAPTMLGLVRITLNPGARLPEGVAAGPIGLVGESGVLTIRTDRPLPVRRGPTAGKPPTTADSTPSVDIELAPGDALTLPVGTRYALRNPGPVAAVVLGAAAFPRRAPSGATVPERAPALVPWQRELLLPARNPAPNARTTSPLPDGVTAVSLAATTLPAPRLLPATLVLARVVLPAGASLPLVAMDSHLLLVEHGTAGIALAVGEARSWSGPGPILPTRVPPGDSPVALAPGAAVALAAGAAAALTASDVPLTVVVLSLDGDPPVAIA